MANLGTAYIPTYYDLPWAVHTDSGLSASLRTELAAFSLEPHENMVVQPLWTSGAKEHSTATSHAHGTHSCTGNTFGLFDIIYNNVMVYPTSIAVGTITDPCAYTIVVWNTSKQYQNVVLSRAGWEGILDTGGARLALKSMEYTTLRIDISMKGPADIDAVLSFFCESFGETLVKLYGKRGEVWNFHPNAGLKETWEWRTEIARAWDYSEHRTALRVVPRQIHECEYTVPAQDASRFEVLLYTRFFYYFLFPCFEQHVPVLSHAGDRAIVCDTASSVWHVGSQGVLYAQGKTELFTVAAVTEQGLELEAPLAQNFGACLLMPCVMARLLESAHRKDSPAAPTVFSTKFLLTEPPQWNVAETVPQWDGIDVWDMELFTEAKYDFECPVITLDNGISTPRQFHARPLASKTHQVTLHCDSLQEIMHMRGMVLRRQGCVRPFWASSRRQDMTVLAPVLVDKDTIRIAPLGQAATKLVEARQKIALRFELSDGLELFRYVRAVTPFAQYDELQLTEALFQDRDREPQDFVRVSFMTLCRLASDTVEWTWKRTNRADLSLAITELSL